MRAFIGLPLPEEGRALVEGLRETLGMAERRVAWIRPEDAHLTLSFLGELDETGIAAARRAIDLPDRPLGRVSIGALDYAFFPNRRTPRVLVVLATKGAPALSRLHAGLCAALARESRQAGIAPLDAEWPDADIDGSRPRRPFRAHFSVARLRAAAGPGLFGPEALLRAHGLLAATPPLVFDRLTLFESRLGGGEGTRYFPLFTRQLNSSP